MAEDTKTPETVKPVVRENRQENGQFGKDNNANPAGRPKGRTIKERIREYLEDNPEEMLAFVEHFVKDNRALAWQMLEGRPPQDVTSGGEKLPTPILRLDTTDKE